MSGTSLDGLDIASCVFIRRGEQWQYQIEEAECVSYSDDWMRRLNEAPCLNGYEITLLDTEYGFFIGGQVKEFCQRYNLQPDLISSHGHTVFHDPAQHISLQIGKGAAISAVTGLPAVSDFRSLDVSAGGQGAPLVPVADKLLFSEYGFCLNLGGIANISYDEGEKRIAYDISPCNLILNRLAEQAGKKYDEGGALARSGKIDENLLDQLNAWAYYRAAPPKSLDKEALLKEWLPILEANAATVPDKLATVTEHIAQMIGIALKKSSGRVLVTGGGAFNAFLIERIKQHCKAEVIVPDENIVAYKEALAFAFLGLLRVLNEPNCLKSVTGARENIVGGALYGDFSRLPL
jgi:anhydro-N-acetylmuramic acid kinase